MNLPDVVFAELCQADPGQSVFLLPSDDSLRRRLCAINRLQLAVFALNFNQQINVNSIQKEVYLVFFL